MPEVDDSSTRERILHLVVENGPVAVHDLAGFLGLTAAGVRRHIGALEEAGLVVVHDGAPRPSGRGRPARRYVGTERAQAALRNAYSDLAAEALDYLATVAGPQAVQAFAHSRATALGSRLQAGVVGVDDLVERTERLATALSKHGYAASVRDAPGGRSVQLCQGHCPVLDVAARIPALCEAETRMLGDLLGVPVQRLSTLATGAHVCTTHVALARTSRVAPISTHIRTTAPIDHPDSRPRAAMETDR
jgi:predicted ArsR family transcriptional regulator